MQKMLAQPFSEIKEMQTKAPWVVDVEMPEIHLCSSIDLSYRQELEDLFFFNPNQQVVRDRVVEHIERYGNPEIRTQSAALTMGLKLVDQAQTIFLMMGRSGRAKLVGVVLYVREADCLRVLYVALKHAYTWNSEGTTSLMVFIVEALTKIARSIKGLKLIEFAVGPRVAVFKL